MDQTSSELVVRTKTGRRADSTSEIEVARTYTFDASHQLHWHPGKCARLHGHTYDLGVVVGGPLDVHGVVIDFEDLDAVVHPHVIEVLDHVHLNDVVENPTVENLLRHIWDALEAQGLPLREVTLWETRRSWARIRA